MTNVAPVSVQEIFITAAHEAVRKIGAEGTVTVTHRRPLRLKLQFADGVTFSTLGTTVPLNSVVTRRLLKNKWLTASTLKDAGIARPEPHLVRAGDLNFPDIKSMHASRIYRDIREFIATVGGFPVFTKPTDGSQGRGVFRAGDANELDQIFMKARMYRRRDIMVEEACVGNEELRILAVAGKIELAMRKDPLSIVADGEHTIEYLIGERLSALKGIGRDITIKPTSDKIKSHLAQQGMSLSDIIADKGHVVFVLANKNLSDGGEPSLCTNDVRIKYGGDVKRIATALEAELVGLDVLWNTRVSPPRLYVIEGNGTPGLKHFMRSGAQNPDLIKAYVVSAIEHAHRLHLVRRDPNPPVSAPALKAA